jgi:hypothetical protein
MSEEKNSTTKGMPLKKSASSQTSSNRKSKKEPMKEIQTTPTADTEPALSLIKRIGEIVHQIENMPLKSIGKGSREKLLQSYEKLILKMVREINSSRK